MRDPLEEDEYSVTRREAERAREQEWEAFIQICQNFAERERWSGVIAAVSRAMRESEREINGTS